jgi:hypothetical protein
MKCEWAARANLGVAIKRAPIKRALIMLRGSFA